MQLFAPLFNESFVFQDKRANMQIHYEQNLDQHMSLLMGRLIALAASHDILKEDLATAQRSVF